MLHCSKTDMKGTMAGGRQHPLAGCHSLLEATNLESKHTVTPPAWSALVLHITVQKELMAVILLQLHWTIMGLHLNSWGGGGHLCFTFPPTQYTSSLSTQQYVKFHNSYARKRLHHNCFYTAKVSAALKGGKSTTTSFLLWVENHFGLSLVPAGNLSLENTDIEGGETKPFTWTKPSTYF